MSRAINFIEVDIVVFGSGVAGLSVAKALLESGRRVLVVEREAKISSGATTRSGDLVHAGAFHSALIDDEERAFETAVACMKGAREILGECQEAVMRDAAPVLVAISDRELCERAVRRWSAWRIPHTEVGRRTAEEMIALGASRHPAGARFFMTEDKPFAWARYCDALHVSILSRGGRVLVGADLRERDVASCRVRVDSREIEVRFALAIHATGSGVSTTFAQHGHCFDRFPEVQIWKSLSLRLPRKNRNGFIYVDPGMPSFMPSGVHTVVNVSQLDDLAESPDFGVDTRQIPGMARALAEIGLDLKELLSDGGTLKACLKPSVVNHDGGRRRVDVVVEFVSPRDLVVFPGKATNAPILASRVLSQVFP